MVGFFLVVGIIAIFAALFILTDAAFFRGRYVVSTVVTDAGGIRRGDPVQMRGVNIGRVQRFKIAKENVEIRLELEGEYNVPKDSHVELKSGGLLGGTVADVIPGDATEYLRNGDHIDGRMVPGLFDAANRVAGQVEKLMTDTTVKNIAATTDNAQVASRDLRRLIADVSSAVAEQRKTLATLEASLQKSAVGLERVTTGPELDRALKRLDTLGERMDTVTASLQRSSESVETVAARAAKGEGSLGKLMTDEELYRDLNQTRTT